MAETIERVLVIGASGYMGSAICAGLRDTFEVFGTFKSHPTRIDGVTCFPFDLLNGEDVNQALKRFRPDAIIVAGGMTDRVKCEASPAEAEVVNFKALALFFKITTDPFHFFHLSCDDVFFKDALQGKSQFAEDATGTPIDAFTRSKVQAETFTVSQRKRSFNLRLGRVFGEGFGATGYPRYSWLEAFQQQLERKQPVRVDDRVKRNHVYLGDVVRGVKIMCQKAPLDSRTYHFASNVAMTDCELLKNYCEQRGLSPELVVPLTGDKSVSLTLKSERFAQDFGFEFQKPPEAVNEYIERMRTGFTRGWT